MNLRQKINILLILFLILVTFASYHEGSTLWLQYLTVLTIFVYLLFFDMAFTNDSQFIFDPDAENWRRKTVRIQTMEDSLTVWSELLIEIERFQTLPNTKG